MREDGKDCALASANLFRPVLCYIDMNNDDDDDNIRIRIIITFRARRRSWYLFLWHRATGKLRFYSPCAFNIQLNTSFLDIRFFYCPAWKLQRARPACYYWRVTWASCLYPPKEASTVSRPTPAHFTMTRGWRWLSKLWLRGCLTNVRQQVA